MCGIVGYFGKNADAAALNRMIGTLRHRGPDDVGLWISPDRRFGLAHSRLSIIDCTDAGHQPMSFGEGRYWISFNGEIYNYREIRRELELQGHRFRSNSDTEVLLAAYAEWGPSCASRLLGMFAMAIVDLRPKAGEPELFLCRDRLGIKPLLCAETAGGVWFASELRALLSSGGIAAELNRDSVLDFLSFGSVLQPATIFNAIRAVPPGTIVTFRGGRRSEMRYWDLDLATKELRERLKNISYSEAVDGIKSLLAESARYHLVADVPVGAFLSGGVDSTLVLGLMKEVSNASINTFTVGFENTLGSIDEREYARIAAGFHDARHHEIALTPADAVNSFDDIVNGIDQPSIDGANTWFVSRGARSEVKVAVSGLGGDEIFAGYPHFNWVSQPGYRHGGLPIFPQHAAERLYKMWPSVPTLMLMFYRLRPEQRLARLRRLMVDSRIRTAAGPIWDEGYPERLLERLRGYVRTDGDGIQFASYAEINTYLISTLLRDVDVMSMAHGLEVRPLLLHHPLVEYAYALPARFKLSMGRGKRVLIEAGHTLIPDKIRKRKKIGFELPFAAWMGSAFCGRALDLLSIPIAKDYFSVPYLTELRKQTHEGHPPREVWAWCIFLRWLELNRI